MPPVAGVTVADNLTGIDVLTDDAPGASTVDVATFVIEITRETDVALAKPDEPDWLAVRMQLPAPTSRRFTSDTVHTAAVDEANTTGNPEEADPARMYGD